MAELESMPRDEIIKGNIEAFLPYICYCVKATDLLTRLQYFTKEQRKEIFQLACSNAIEATRRAMDVILNDCQEPGRFVAFKHAISEYPKIVQMLEGEHVPCDANCQKIVDLFTLEIINRLDPMHLLAALTREGTITSEDAEEIRAEQVNHTRIRACWRLLFFLPNRVDNWFKKFNEALIEYGYEDLSKILDPDFYAKIMLQKREAAEQLLKMEEERHREKQHFLVDSGSSCGNFTDVLMAAISRDAGHSESISDVKVFAERHTCIAKTKHELCNGTLHKKTSIKTATSSVIFQNNFDESDDEEADDSSFEIENITDTVAGVSINEAEAGDTKSEHYKNVTEESVNEQYTQDLNFDFLLDAGDGKGKTHPEDMDFTLEMHNNHVTDDDTDNQLNGNLQENNHNQELVDDVEQTLVVSNKAMDMDTLDVADNIKLEVVNLSTYNTNVADSIDEAVNLLMDNQIKEASGRDKKVDGDVMRVVDNIKGDDDGGTQAAHNTESGVGDIKGEVGVTRGAAAVGEVQPAQEPEGAVGGQLDFSSLLNPFTRKVDADTVFKVLYSRKGLSLQDNLPLQNDLNFETLQNQGEVDYNIATDEDVIDGVKDVDIELRDYQAELAEEGCAGDNVVVMAPTNTGKTRVACKIMQEHLRRQRREDGIGKVIFLVENEALAFQQGKVCAELLPAYRTKVISGSVQRDKKQYLRDFIDRRDILVVTAQVLVNGLKLKEVERLTQFSLIVFDECHHTANLHRFNEIMSKYMDLKIKENLRVNKLPQIVGLTASLGVGGNTKEAEAMDHMKGLLANLDAKHLCTVRRNVQELRFYENNPDEKIVVARRRGNDLYRKAVCEIMDLIDLYMHTHASMVALPKQDADIQDLCRVPPNRGTEQFMQWLSVFKEGIGRVRSDAARRMLNPCRLHLEVYNKALLIHTDATTKEAEAILEEFMEEEKLIDPKDETDNMLLELYRTLERKDFSNEPPNPKLVKMQEIVMETLGNNEDGRGIVFVKTRDLAKALVRWMNETQPLKELNAIEFVGQAASAAEGGMTKSGQKDALEYFKDGRHKIIIATSVAEEGLDITKCNLVIRYEHVTNEIVRLQSRGRARAQDSKYFVLTEEGSWIVAKEEKNAMLEKLMNKIVPKLQAYIEDNPNMWERELRDMQESAKNEEDLREEQRQSKMTADEVELRCLNCSALVCFSSDIRVIQGAHHVIVDEDAQRRLRSERNPVPKFMEDELKFDGTTYCGNFSCQRELGGVCEYRHAEFPLIKIKNFRVVGKNGEGRTFKQWKKVNFVVQPFSLEDLRDLVERRLAEIQ